VPYPVTGGAQRFFGRQRIEAEVCHPQHRASAAGQRRIEMRGAFQTERCLPAAAAAAAQDLQMMLGRARCRGKRKSPAVERRMRADDAGGSAFDRTELRQPDAGPDRFHPMA
jgi:hypothetical protein